MRIHDTVVVREVSTIYLERKDKDDFGCDLCRHPLRHNGRRVANTEKTIVTIIRCGSEARPFPSFIVQGSLLSLLFEIKLPMGPSGTPSALR